jgi:FkbM family methyltransferase
MQLAGRAEPKGRRMAEFTLKGVTLFIPDDLMTEQLTRAMTSGKYESSEAEALMRHLRPRDRFLDLGAGAGYLSSLAGAVIRTRRVTGVEAGPEMARVAQDNLRRNGIETGEIRWGAIVPDSFAGEEVTFALRRSFWASTLTPPEGAKNTRAVTVPALRFGSILAQVDPTVLSIDIEGGEQDLFDAALPPDLRLIVMELHPAVYGKRGVKQIFDRLSVQGFAYCPVGSKAGTVVFERLAPDP